MRPGVRAAAYFIVVVGALAPLVGCGGSSGEPASKEPTIPRRIADELADRADEVARLLDQGDACGAARVVRDLKRATNRAIADGGIPAELRAPLEAAVADLEGIQCTEGEGTTTEGEATTTEETASTPTTTAAETTSGTTTASDTTTGITTTTEGPSDTQESSP